MPLSTAARAYLTIAIASGFAVLAWSVQALAAHPPDNRLWLALLALTCFSSTFSIRLPKVSTTVSVSETFVFLSALLYGPAVATIVVGVDGLMIAFWRRHRRVLQVLFNVAGPALSIWTAALVFELLAGHEIGRVHAVNVYDGLVPFAGFTLAYFALNSGLNAGIVALQRHARLWSVWRPHFGVLLLSYCGSASVAALLIYNSRDFDISTIAMVLPLLVISYFTFKTSLQRVEDANHHLEQMNRLYLSTIETLAMAVDATDQITHGHIRRVQTWAVGLARALGVTDASQLKAIEAAALLHDVGKMAIPEHILNKPGRLSPAEFEKMKRHASIGADILSAIDFPYPVVPIVRHHHEQWNGAGYPEGLSGADIPIGARILAVVDCFDALTSDRPYRRALSDQQAISMLIEQRGRAYDPLVVDTFARVYREIAPVEGEVGARGETLREIAQVSHTPSSSPRSAPVPVFAPDALPLAEVLVAGAPRTAVNTLARDVAESLLHVTPATLCVIYGLDEPRGTLVPVQASGALADAARTVHIAVSERLSGWVAANQRTICNSDASLDFVDRDDLGPAFRSCLSVPLACGDALEGVVSLYAPAPAAFTESQRLAVESVSRTLAHLVRGLRAMAEVERLASPGALATVPVFEPRGAIAGLGLNPRTLAVLSLRISQTPPWGQRHALLARGASQLRRALRETDLVCRDGDSGLLALLPGADARVAHQVAARVLEALGADVFTAGVAAAPADGWDLQAVVETSRRRTDMATGVALVSEEEGRRPRQPALFDDGRPGPRMGVA